MSSVASWQNSRRGRVIHLGCQRQEDGTYVAELSRPLKLPFNEASYVALTQLWCNAPKDVDSWKNPSIKIRLKQLETVVNPQGVLSVHDLRSSSGKHVYSPETLTYYAVQQSSAVLQKFVFQVTKNDEDESSLFNLEDAAEKEKAKTIVIQLLFRQMDISDVEYVPLHVHAKTSVQQHPDNYSADFVVDLPPGFTGWHHRPWYLAVQNLTAPTDFGYVPAGGKLPVAWMFGENLDAAVLDEVEEYYKGTNHGIRRSNSGMFVLDVDADALNAKSSEEELVTSLMAEMNKIGFVKCSRKQPAKKKLVTYEYKSSVRWGTKTGAPAGSKAVIIRMPVELFRVFGFAMQGEDTGSQSYIMLTVKLDDRSPLAAEVKPEAYKPDLLRIFCDLLKEDEYVGSDEQQLLTVLPVNASASAKATTVEMNNLVFLPIKTQHGGQCRIRVLNQFNRPAATKNNALYRLQLLVEVNKDSRGGW